jgi:flagellar protein FlaG
MNEISKVVSLPLSVKPIAASSVSYDGQNTRVDGQKSGNDLPPLDKAATIRQPETVVNTQLQEDVKAAVTHMNKYIQTTQRDLSFSYDADRGETVVKVVDRSTQEVIRQIPDAIFIKIAEHMTADLPGGLLFAEV